MGILVESQTQLEQMYKDFGELLVMKTLMETGQIKKFISKNKAYEIYGQKWINDMIAAGKLKQYKEGNNTSPCKIDIFEAKALHSAGTRWISLQQTERKTA